MDRNQIIGILLITLAIFTYINFWGPNKKTNVTNKKENIEQSLNSSLVSPSIEQKNTLKKEVYGLFSQFTQGEEKIISLENSDIKIFFTNKGGSIQRLVLKKYDDANKQPLDLFNKKSSDFALKFQHQNLNISSKDLFFDYQVKEDNKTIVFKVEVEPGKYISQEYSIDPHGYEVNYKIKSEGISELVTSDKLSYVWVNNLKPLERDIKKSRSKATINYYTSNNKFNNLKIKQNDPVIKDLTDDTKWISYKQCFFTSGIIAEHPLRNVHLEMNPVSEDNKEALKKGLVSFEFDKSILLTGASFRYFFGPNKYHVLKSVTPGFDNNLFLGWPVVKWINRFVTTPIFKMLQKITTNFGIIIILLVLILKTLLFPLSYKSYYSMAKMKVLKPEIDEIKEKYKSDPKKVQLEQMNLYRELGVNPLSGCLPILMQMPLLIAMFNFFPNAIEMRHASFLWVKDLSTYDSILTLPYSIPVYGDHVSLFTLLMTISTIVSTWMNSQMNSSGGDPSMKLFSYLMPLMFMFILNSFPASLSFYYFISNVFTIAQQALISRFVDEKSLRNKLEENRKKSPGKTNTVSRAFTRLQKKKKK